MFSRTTIPLSRIIPLAKARPASETTLTERPNTISRTKVPTMQTGMVRPTMMVEVIDRISNEPVTGLDISGLAQFSDLADLSAEQIQDFNGYSFRLEPTEIDGTYVATIDLPDHPDGVAGREVTIDVTFDGIDTERVSAIKKFQTWW